MKGRDEGRELPVVGAERLPAHGQAHGPPLDRRTLLKLMVAAAAAPAVGGCGTVGGDAEAGGAAQNAAEGAAARASASATNPLAAGTAWDPDLLSPVVRWETVLTPDELETLAALCDAILPADERSPSASDVGAHHFIDEWVSAPYPSQERDLVTVRGGLVWLDAEAARRFGAGSRFRALDDAGRRTICDDIRSSEGAAPRFRAAARFFDTVRDLTTTAFYTTPEGMADLGYVGNRPVAGPWPPPPPEALRHLGLEVPPGGGARPPEVGP